jgi:hypothetical protein
MGFNRRKMEDERRRIAEKEAASRRATDAQVLEDAERLIAAWNDRQAKRMPMLFSPTIGAANRRALLVSVGVLPSVPNHQRDSGKHCHEMYGDNLLRLNSARPATTQARYESNVPRLYAG